MDKLMGRNEYARHRGCSPNAVKKAEDSGRIAGAVKRDEKGEFVGIDWRLADELWAGNTDPAEAARNGKSLVVDDAADASPGPGPADQLPLEQVCPPPGEISPPARDGKDPHGYLAARASRERHQEKLTELELLKEIGSLISLDEQRRVSARRYRAMRDKFLNIADRVAPVLAAERDPLEIHATLTAEMERVLHELSDDAAAEVARGAAERVAA